MVQPSGLKWAALISQSLCPSWPPNENVAISPPEGTACSASSSVLPLSGSLSVSKPACRSGRGETSRSEEHTSELQSLMRISYAVFCLKKKKQTKLINISRVIRHLTELGHMI